MNRIYCLIIGYLFGIVQSGYIVGKLKGIDIRDYGSGNSGATNALRVMGWKAGGVVYVCDLFKCMAACWITWKLFGTGPWASGIDAIYVLYTGIGCILGHNYPFYMHFHGGKGIAVTSGVILLLDWRIAIVAAVLFFGEMIVTGYVSLGSMMMVFSLFMMWLVLGVSGDLNIAPEYLTESYFLVFFIAALAIIRHRSNIRRLIDGTEKPMWRHRS